jgi:hypothetical protein
MEYQLQWAFLHQKKVSISVFEMPFKRAERKTHYVKCPINYTVKQVWEQVFSLYIRVWGDGLMDCSRGYSFTK